MKTVNVLKLIPGQIVMHNYFRECKVEEVILDQYGGLFGVKINPIYHSDRLKIKNQFGVPYLTPYLCASVREIKAIPLTPIVKP